MCRVIASLWLSKVESLEESVIHDWWGITPDIRWVETSGPPSYTVTPRGEIGDR